MEDNKPVKAGEALTQEQATSISGGDGTSCTSTASGGSTGFSVQTAAPDPGAALTAIYEGFVDVTSHIIERVVNTAK